MKAIQKRRAMTGQSGFTLIELLVVIAILGVLAAVVVFAVSGITNNSAESACKIDARTVKTAVQAYIAENTTEPADEAELVSGGLLEAESDLVDYDNTATPKYSWTGDCTSVSGLPANP